MLMSDVLMWVAIAAAFVFGATALWMLNRGLWPAAFEKRLTVASMGVGMNLLIGLLPTAIAMGLLIAGGKRLGILVLLVASAFIAYGLSGVSGYASIIGNRLWPAAEPWKQTRNGGLVIMCCALFPVVGWFLLLPALIVIGVGVHIRAMLGGGSGPAASTPTGSTPAA